MAEPTPTPKPTQPAAEKPSEPGKPKPAATPAETGGPTGPEPTRYGDWERGGRCIDF